MNTLCTLFQHAWTFTFRIWVLLHDWDGSMNKLWWQKHTHKHTHGVHKLWFCASLRTAIGAKQEGIITFQISSSWSPSRAGALRAPARASGRPALCLPSAHPRASSPPADPPLRMSHRKVGQESRVRRARQRGHRRGSLTQSSESFRGRSERRSGSAASLVGVSCVCGMFRGTGSVSPPLSSGLMITEQQPLPTPPNRPRFTCRAACWYLNVVGTCWYPGDHFSAGFYASGWKCPLMRSWESVACFTLLLYGVFIIIITTIIITFRHYNCS